MNDILDICKKHIKEQEESICFSISKKSEAKKSLLYAEPQVTLNNFWDKLLFLLTKLAVDYGWLKEKFTSSDVAKLPKI